MATPIGANDVTAIVNRYLIDTLVDVVYPSNPITYRLHKQKKVVVSGGTQIEVPLMFSRFAAGGWYQGYDALSMVPSNTVKNLAFDWKQAYVPVVVDNGTLMRTDSPDAIYNYISQKWMQAEIEMAEILGTALWSDGIVDPKSPDGLKAIVDNGSVAATYGGNLRSGFTALNSTIDSATSTLTLNSLIDLVNNASEGGRHPTVIVSRKEQWARYVKLNVALQQYFLGPSGADESMASAGFTTAVFSGIPWLVDSHVFDGPNASNSSIVALNEDYFQLVINKRADFRMEPFQKPVNQDVFASAIYWGGNLVCMAPGRQAKMTNISA